MIIDFYKPLRAAGFTRLEAVIHCMNIQVTWYPNTCSLRFWYNTGTPDTIVWSEMNYIIDSKWPPNRYRGGWLKVIRILDAIYEYPETIEKLMGLGYLGKLEEL